jgi:AraC-like DNA-binding protein
MNYLEGFIGIGLAFSIVFFTRWVLLGGIKSFSQKVSALLLLIICIELFYGWAYVSNWIITHPFIIRFNTPFVLLIGPALYWFVSSIVKGNYAWKKQDWLHFLPFILCLLYFTPLYIQSILDKSTYVDAMIKELSFDSYLWGGIRRVQQLGYLVVSGFILYQRTTKAMRQNHIWTVMLVLGFSLLWALDIYRYFFKFDLMTGLLDSVLLSIMIVCLIYINLGNRVKEKKPYAKSKLSSEKINSLYLKICHDMESQKRYLNKKLSLSDLSELLQILPNHLSQVVNEKSQMNFNDFVNKFRIEAAKKLLKSPKTTILTLEAIAEESGFNSSSTFNAAFKKHTGHTPKYYRQTKSEV